MKFIGDGVDLSRGSEIHSCANGKAFAYEAVFFVCFLSREYHVVTGLPQTTLVWNVAASRVPNMVTSKNIQICLHMRMWFTGERKYPASVTECPIRTAVYSGKLFMLQFLSHRVSTLREGYASLCRSCKVMIQQW